MGRVPERAPPNAAKAGAKQGALEEHRTQGIKAHARIVLQAGAVQSIANELATEPGADLGFERGFCTRPEIGRIQPAYPARALSAALDS